MSYTPTRGSISFIRDALAQALLSTYDEDFNKESLQEVLTDAMKEMDALQDWIVDELKQLECAADHVEYGHAEISGYEYEDEEVDYDGYEE